MYLPAARNTQGAVAHHETARRLNICYVNQGLAATGVPLIWTWIYPLLLKRYDFANAPFCELLRAAMAEDNALIASTGRT